MSNVEQLNKDLIVLTNEQMNNFLFQQALQKLKNLPVNAKAAYNIGYIANKIENILRDSRIAFTKMAKQYGKLDENGELLPVINEENGMPVPGTFQFKDDEAKDEFNKYNEEFMQMSHTINRDKMSIVVLGDATLSANDMSALAPLFCDLED